MFIHTDFLRAALCCVADQKEERRYLQGVNITSTHIQATDGRCAISMEHGSPDALKGVYIFTEDIPCDADGTYIKVLDDGALVAEHVTEDNCIISRKIIESVRESYPDFSKIIDRLDNTPKACTLPPIYQAQLLALPYRMFDIANLPVQLVSWGDGEIARFIFDKATNHLYGNPWLTIMPMKADAFELLEKFYEESH